MGTAPACGLCLLIASAGSGQTIEQLLGALNLRFRKIQIVQSFEATAALIEAGLGLGILPHRIASSLQKPDSHLMELKLAGCESDWGRHRIELCYLKDKQFHPRLQRFEFHLKSWIGSLDVNSFACKSNGDPAVCPMGQAKPE